MLVTKPDFFDKFRCTASACSDSCCIGWEIDIDDETLSKYNSTQDKFRGELLSGISYDGQPHFRLCKNERCVFLNDKNLCRIILNTDEGYLCDICREHPRFYEWYGERKDAGLGLCCEEACRLLFSSDAPLNYIEYETDEEADDSCEMFEAVYTARNKLFGTVNDRSLSLKDRLYKILSHSGKDEAFKTDSIVNICKAMEPFDDKWSIFTEKLENKKDSIEASASQFTEYISNNEQQYERLMSYLIFRHFIKAIYDGDTQTHLRFAVIFLIIQRIADIMIYNENGQFTLADRIGSTKYLSKQIEYSEENIDILLDYCERNTDLTNLIDLLF